MVRSDQRLPVRIDNRGQRNCKKYLDWELEHTGVCQNCQMGNLFFEYKKVRLDQEPLHREGQR